MGGGRRAGGTRASTLCWPLEPPTLLPPPAGEAPAVRCLTIRAQPVVNEDAADGLARVREPLADSVGEPFERIERHCSDIRSTTRTSLEHGQSAGQGRPVSRPRAFSAAASTFRRSKTSATTCSPVRASRAALGTVGAQSLVMRPILEQHNAGGRPARLAMFPCFCFCISHHLSHLPACLVANRVGRLEVVP